MSNLWKLLQGVLPGEALRIGTIAVVNPNNTVQCTMADGGTLTVRGTGSVADVVFIYAGQVQSAVSGLVTFSATDV